jgi:hypothetical protein
MCTFMTVVAHLVVSSDVQITDFLLDVTLKQVIPHMEQKIRMLNQQVRDFAIAVISNLLSESTPFCCIPVLKLFFGGLSISR